MEFLDEKGVINIYKTKGYFVLININEEKKTRCKGTSPVYYTFVQIDRNLQCD